MTILFSVLCLIGFCALFAVGAWVVYRMDTRRERK